jgi:hypothetical protein
MRYYIYIYIYVEAKNRYARARRQNQMRETLMQKTTEQMIEQETQLKKQYDRASYHSK